MIWTGPNDAPLSTKEERMAELSLDFRDVVRNLEWWEVWPVCQEALAIVDSLRIDNGQVVGRTVDINADKITLHLVARATLREVVARGHLVDEIIENSSSRHRHFTKEVIENAMPIRIDPL